MEPSESQISADLTLSLPKSLEKELDLSLRSGDHINFVAKLLTMGDQHKLTHLHVLSIEKLQDRKDLKQIIINESSLPTGLPDDNIVIEGQYDQELVPVNSTQQFDDEGNEING